MNKPDVYEYGAVFFSGDSLLIREVGLRTMVEKRGRSLQVDT